MDLMPMAYIGSTDVIVFVYSLFGLVGTIFWIVMLVDAIRREFRDSNLKIVWVLVLVFTHLLGALIYFFAGRSMGRLPTPR